MDSITAHPAPNGVFFFSARLTDSASTLLTDEVDRLRDAMRRTIARYPFQIDAIAVLPAAVHTIWTLPGGDTNHALRWDLIKSIFSRGVPDPVTRTARQRRRGAKGIWQHRAWHHAIHSAEDFARHRALIHASPVQAGLCAAPEGWPHSSIHRDKQRAITKIKPLVLQMPAASLGQKYVHGSAARIPLPEGGTSQQCAAAVRLP